MREHSQRCVVLPTSPRNHIPGRHTSPALWRAYAERASEVRRHLTVRDLRRLAALILKSLALSRLPSGQLIRLCHKSWGLEVFLNQPKMSSTWLRCRTVLYHSLKSSSTQAAFPGTCCRWQEGCSLAVGEIVEPGHRQPKCPESRESSA